MKNFRLFLFIFTLGVISSGCVKEQPVPDLPPSQSFVLEIDEFWSSSPAPDISLGLFNKSNFLFAAATVYWWDAVLTVHLVVPVAAFLESFNHVPIWDRTEKAWIWSYTVDIDNVSYTAELFGEPATDHVNWSMYISKSSGYTDFLWFTGSSQNDNSSGSWTINKSPESINKEEISSIPLIDIVWNLDEDGSSQITYTNILEGSADNGNYITYGLVDDPDLNAFYEIYRTWEDNLVSIKWNTTSHYGRILSMVHFQDPYWHCWNELFENTDCE